NQSLRLWVNDWVVPSEKWTVKTWPAWLPCTPVASILSEVNLPAGSVTVVLVTALAVFGAPNLNSTPFRARLDPSKLAEYECPPPSSPPVKVVPSVTIPGLILNAPERSACTPEPVAAAPQFAILKFT